MYPFAPCDMKPLKSSLSNVFRVTKLVQFQIFYNYKNFNEMI
jgi:hypothetical protein